jgi:PAS domain S-box-containing protein
MLPRPEPDFLKAILENPQISVISTDETGKVRTFNRGAEELLGYKADEMIGKLTPEVWHDPDETRQRSAELTRDYGVKVNTGFYTFTAEATITDAPTAHEWIYIRKDGSRIKVVLAVSMLRDSHGKMCGYIGIAMRIPERQALANAG